MIVGTGYVGLVTGACLAELGHEVLCVDKNAEKIEGIRRGIMPIYEANLPELVAKHINKNLFFTTSLAKAVQHTDLLFFALPTPALPDGNANVSLIFQVLSELIPLIHKPITILIKSTVPVGTAQKIQTILDKNVPFACEVVSNPEFLREGFAVQDALNPTRIVVGTKNETLKPMFATLYAPYTAKNIPLLFMDLASAELSKYAANAFLATKISFINQMANLAEKVGADIQDIASVMGEDPRIGKLFLNAGCGYGGSCLPKDVKALIHTGAENNLDLSIICAVDAVNQKQKTKLIEEILEHYAGEISGKTFAIWGLAFKPNTDDIREAPAFTMIEALLQLGAQVKVFDFQAMDNTLAIFQDQIEYGKDMYQTLEGTDALLIATEWPDFKKADLPKIATLVKDKIIFDGRNLYALPAVRMAGLQYISMGRKLKRYVFA